ncbi:LptA/OstA family protein [Chthonobacter albigriseus]|uniref:LptA/OstA family protein n=1 Tax=Chthonobacter albigriseus TaxID=1683161 RepID=UPI0015EFC47D|nr:LptA/OstA family protein [Chthonobacter albigriseus]
MIRSDLLLRRRFAAAALAAAVAFTGGTAIAQTQKQTGTMPNAFQGLGVSGDQPINFEAESLEVRDQDAMAIFSGNVVVRQNQTVLKTAKLTVFYERDETAAGAAKPAENQQQQVRRLEAEGDVLVSSGPQTASGNNAVFDTKAQTILVSGNVVLTQGDNVIRGPRLVINVATGQAKMEGGRVQMLIEPKSLQQSQAGN